MKSDELIDFRLQKSVSLTARVFVGAVAAVLLAVAEEAALDTVSVTAR